MNDTPSQIRAVLERAGGGMTLHELVYQTRQPVADVMAAIATLEEQGHIGPATWCSREVFDRLTAWAGASCRATPSPTVEDGNESA